MLSRILDKHQHFIWMELLWLDEWGVARREHAEIVHAICAGDGERASHHVRCSGNNILRLLKAQTASLAKAS
jgi:DNA-binding GntR family transcriptional regulator